MIESLWNNSWSWDVFNGHHNLILFSFAIAFIGMKFFFSFGGDDVLRTFFSEPSNDLGLAGPMYHTPIQQNVVYHYGVSEIKGRRAYMEDRSTAKGNLNGDRKCSLYGVFDGHGGKGASEYCQEHMCDNIIMQKMWKENPVEALKAGFLQTDREYLELANQKHRDDGTTAIVVLVMHDTIYIANCGDSRAILIQETGAVIPLSQDHKPNRGDERKRISDLGGAVIFWGVWRVEGILAVSRAIGDRMLKHLVVGEPDVQSRRPLAKDRFIVLASDGLWDILSNEEVGRIVQETTAAGDDPQRTSKKIMEEAYHRGSTDNICVMVIDVRQEKPQAT